jgi:hypothetical protein
MNKIYCPRTREAIASRFRAGDSVAELAHDYEQPTEAIEAAIREGVTVSSFETLSGALLDLADKLDEEAFTHIDTAETVDKAQSLELYGKAEGKRRAATRIRVAVGKAMRKSK